MELVKYRVSQIIGCAYCLDMHHNEAIHHGETELRLHSLSAWKECPYYTDKERTVLEFTKALTLIREHQIADEIFETLSDHFSKQEIADLTLLVNQISTPTMKPGQKSDRQNIEAVLDNYAIYWNDNDMVSWGTLFADDVDYINRKWSWWKKI